MSFDACCMYFCTGLSIFGTAGLLFMGYVLQSGKNWFLGVSDEGAKAAATACYIAAALYLGYVLMCGRRIMAANKRAERSPLLEQATV